MGLFSWIFGGRKDIHVHLHIDGSLDINSDAIQPTSSISKKWAANESKTLADIIPELENIDIPDVDFGDTIDE